MITAPEGYIDSPIDPESVYANRRYGFVDSEDMTEVKPGKKKVGKKGKKKGVVKPRLKRMNSF